ncbi:MAG: DUF1214 domain-containing protein [Steroidobacteraceae bacterium]
MSASADQGLLGVWQQLCKTLEEQGRFVLSSVNATDDVDRVEGLRFVTRMLRYALESQLEFADPQYPGFYCPSHETLKINSDNPDTLHFMTNIRGDLDYEIRGRRGTVHRMIFSSMARGAPGDLQVTGALDSEKLEVDANGNFTITVSKQRPPAGNWLPLSDNSITVLARAIFMDRSAETAPAMTIHRAGNISPPRPLSTAQAQPWLGAVALMTRAMTQRMNELTSIYRARGWINSLAEDTALWAAGDPGSRYLQGYWEIAAEQALVIEFEEPACRFWNFQVNNIWLESLDYRFERIHVNKSSVRRTAGNPVRLVLSARDPGMDNWLSTSGHSHGTMVSRWIESERVPEMKVSLVKLADLGR